jgi:hypothetical protein
MAEQIATEQEYRASFDAIDRRVLTGPRNDE